MQIAVTVAATALAMVGVLGAPAGLAGADDKNAEQTINELRSQGYTVNIDRIGTAPLSDCVVTSVRNPQQVTQWVPAVGPVLGNKSGTVLVETVVNKSISVSLNCNRS